MTKGCANRSNNALWKYSGYTSSGDPPCVFMRASSRFLIEAKLCPVKVHSFWDTPGAGTRPSIQWSRAMPLFLVVSSNVYYPVPGPPRDSSHLISCSSCARKYITARLALSLMKRDAMRMTSQKVWFLVIRVSKVSGLTESTQLLVEQTSRLYFNQPRTSCLLTKWTLTRSMNQSINIRAGMEGYRCRKLLIGGLTNCFVNPLVTVTRSHGGCFWACLIPHSQDHRSGTSVEE